MLDLHVGVALADGVVDGISVGGEGAHAVLVLGRRLGSVGDGKGLERADSLRQIRMF